MTLRQAITKVQEIGERHGFAIAIVGGALVRNISKNVKIQRIDSKHKVIYLSSTSNPGVAREEDPGTTVDIDAIAFSKEKNPFSQKTRENFSQLLVALQKLQKTEKTFPAISLEPVFYHPGFPTPNKLFQFVSSIEKYTTEQNFLFRLGNIAQLVKEDSLAIWTYVFGETNERIYSLHPQAIQLRYVIRGFSLKPKDKEKIFGEKSAFAQFIKEFQDKTHHKDDKLFEDWKAFETNIQQSKDISIQIKRTLWNLYWQTIGTYLAHGTGFLGKFLLPLGNTFFAGK